MRFLKFIVLSILLLLFNATFAQKIPQHKLSTLTISWKPIENNYLGKEQALSVLEIKNNGEDFLSPTGWKLYFNFVRMTTPKSEDQKLEIKHVNGDLFSLKPVNDFAGLKPGESIRYQMVSKSWLVNVSDAPQGFYLVWEKDKKIEPLALVKVLPPTNDRKFYRVGGDKETSSLMVYEQNESIKDIATDKLTKVFPTPTFYQEGNQSFNISIKTQIVFDSLFTNEVALLNTDLANLLGKQLKITTKKENVKENITLEKAPLPDEAYELNVSSTGIIIKAGTKSGMFYGIQSLKTLINPANYTKKSKKISLKEVIVKDEPRFSYRGMMLDVARNFQSKDQIKKIIDLMALYKLNTLHFHLNDDEGWRLEIAELPELTQIGGKRAHVFDGEMLSLPPSYGSGAFANTPSGSGYYSKEDFIEIIRYADARHIEVIPEIETPGHARAAIKSMDFRYQRLLKEGKLKEAEMYLLHDFNDKSVYRSVQKWNDNVMDVSMPSVYHFLEVVTDNVIAIYKEAGVPLNTIHFGGDEVPAGAWEQSPAFEKLKLKDTNVKNTEDLWDYFFNKLGTMLDEKGLYLSGWEEVGLHKITVDGKKKWVPNKSFSNRNIHLNVWNNLLGNEDLAYRLANSGYKVIISFVSNFYLDMAYHKKFDEPGFYWGGFTDLAKPYSFIPFDYLKNQQKNYLGRQLSNKVLTESEKLTATGKSNIKGIQGQLWSETVKNTEHQEYLMLPRLLSLAERAWATSPEWAEEADSLKAAKKFETALHQFFNQVGKRELKRLDGYAGGFKYRIPTAGLKEIDGKVHANCELPGFTIRYTKDGTIPSSSSAVYHTPLDADLNLIFRVFNDSGRGSSVSTFKK